MRDTTQFKTEAMARAAIDTAIASGRATSGYVGERFNGGASVFTAHVRKGASGWAL